MSQPAHHTPDVPQPPMQAEAIRATLAQVAPHLLPAFDEDRASSTARAREQVSAVPLQVFTQSWAVEAAIARHPHTAARLRDLETRAGQTADLDEARACVAEFSGFRRAAAAEAGLRAAGGGAR